MVYIAPDGSVHQKPPWSVNRFVGFFWGIINFIIFFFRTLFNLDGSNSSNGRSRSGGGGSRDGGPGGPGGGPRRRPIGRITTIEDCQVPGGG